MTSIFGVEVRAAKPTPDKAVTTLRKGTVGAAIVAVMVIAKMKSPPMNTAR